MSTTTTTRPSTAEAIRTVFSERFGNAAVIVRSPGRVNLIGEHTDYNNGFVLPAAIDKATTVAVSRRNDDVIHLYANDFPDSHLASLDALLPTGNWPDYVLGVVSQLRGMGYALGGFNLVFGGDVPLGAGMSSSAALECATAFALNELFSLGLDRLTMVKAAQAAENRFVGVNCGIMDQFASMFGKKDHVIRLDCRSLDFAYIPFSMDGFRIVLLDTNVKHSLGSSEYNLRRNQCETGVAMIREHLPEVKSLRDADLNMLNRYVAPQDTLIYQRCRYVVEEKERLLGACNDLEAGDMKAFGEKMFRTHHGLSHLYEVSCPELDFLVDRVRNHPGVLGARMMGGGFGGCTINLVAVDAVEELIADMAHQYGEHTGKDLPAYVISIGNGTSKI
ncbi:galactokinase [Flavihumibacter petaseus]|uniref:Galactokinase n=1 Tax=Flavihumibacter petaseus NBRC 106054 TaxID=1220578 RepID=A0A0E9MVP7_9BACT|nr:galactokinase [Flavihumibacter petaseus]GAO41563.1 galactokinase [Flavihumibacter petaseus NBRC 106054]